jgi:hypothetical protein
MIVHYSEHAEAFAAWRDFSETNELDGISGLLDQARDHTDATIASLKSALDLLA